MDATIIRYSYRKFEDSYYDASTPEKRADAFKEILHLAEDWITHPDDMQPSISEEDAEFMKMTRTQIDALPETLKKSVENKLHSIQNRLKDHERYKKTYALCEQVLDATYPENRLLNRGRMSLAEYVVRSDIMIPGTVTDERLQSRDD